MNRSCKHRWKRRGQSLIEFTLVGIPVIFVLISVFEISRGMWIYHTMAYAVKNGVRYASVHGINCVPGSIETPVTDNPNNCTVNMGPPETAGTVLYVIRQAAGGLGTASTTVTFTDAGGTTTNCTLANGSCSTGGIWPPNDATGANNLNSVGKPIRIDIRTPFISALAMLWPTSGQVKFASGTLGASSQDYIQF